MNPDILLVYIDALKGQLMLNSERKNGELNIYALYPESTWVEIFNAELK